MQKCVAESGRERERGRAREIKNAGYSGRPRRVKSSRSRERSDHYGSGKVGRRGESREERDRGHLRGSHSSLEISDMIEAAGVVPQLILQLTGEGCIGGMTPQGRQ